MLCGVQVERWVFAVWCSGGCLLYGVQVERWVFAVWLERLEEREEEQQHLLTLKAREHYRSVPCRSASRRVDLHCPCFRFSSGQTGNALCSDDSILCPLLLLCSVNLMLVSDFILVSDIIFGQ